MQLAKSFPNLRFIVQDLPQVEQAFQANIPSSLTSRVTFQAHDFFTTQNVVADVYFMKAILHDWPDKYAVKILQGLVAAMKPGSRIILCEAVAPSGKEAHLIPLPVQRLISAVDLQMLVAFNSKERTLDNWKSLVAKTDNRLELTNVFSPGNGWSLLEIVFHG